jgi:four helix bundle protein
VADSLGQLKCYRFAEQLRGSGLSIPNNIAEGSGSSSNKEFHHYLNIARRSVFENANMLIIFHEMELLDFNLKERLLDELDILSCKITTFQGTLRKAWGEIILLPYFSTPATLLFAPYSMR